MSRFRHAVKTATSIFRRCASPAPCSPFPFIHLCGWMLAPSKLTVHNPPDLRTGSTRPVGSATPTVYSFAFYIFSSSMRPKTARWIIPAKSMRCRRI